jgi:carbamoylphosphate synthase large subunit
VADADILDHVIAAATELTIDVILPSGEQSVRFLSKNRRAIEPRCALSPIPAPRALAVSRDKWLLAEELRSGGISSPRTLLLQEHPGNEEIPEGFRFPALVKHRIGAGGHGITLVGRREDLPAVLQKSPAPPASRILQEFVPGYDIDCSLLSQNGRLLAWTVQRGILPGSTAYGAPAGIQFCDNPGPLATASAWAAHSGWSGVAHCDMRYDERTGEYTMIEVNPRYWRSLLGSLVAGVNFPLCACLTALAQSYPPPEQKAVKFIHESRVSIRELVSTYTGRSTERFRWSQTNLSFAVHDPLPDIALFLRRVSRRRSSHSADP